MTTTFGHADLTTMTVRAEPIDDRPAARREGSVAAGDEGPTG